MKQAMLTQSRAIAAGIVALFTIASPCAAQQASGMAPPPARAGAAARGVQGLYSYAFTPSNGEPLIGQIDIQRKGTRDIAIFTSPKLNEPVEADSTSIVNGKVYTAVLGGAYTFEFQVNGDAVTNAKFTKMMNGKTESGPAAIRRVSP